jgi:hypothetical protein
MLANLEKKKNKRERKHRKTKREDKLSLSFLFLTNIEFQLTTTILITKSSSMPSLKAYPSMVTINPRKTKR